MRPLALLLCLTGCLDPDPPRLRTLVTVIATQEGQPAEEATKALVAEGRRSLVLMEAALHTADVHGRRRLVRAIQRLGDEDGCPLLGHVAQYDEDEGVRTLARDVLTAWAGESNVRAPAAQSALTRASRPEGR